MSADNILPMADWTDCPQLDFNDSLLDSLKSAVDVWDWPPLDFDDSFLDSLKSAVDDWTDFSSSLSENDAYFDRLMAELGGGLDFDELELVMGSLRQICRIFTSSSSFKRPMTLEAKDAAFKQLQAELNGGTNAINHSPISCTVTIKTGRLGINVALCSHPDSKYAVTFNKFTGISTAKNQTAGCLNSGMVLTHVNGEDQRGRRYSSTLESLEQRPCVMVFTKLIDAKTRSKWGQPGRALEGAENQPTALSSYLMPPPQPKLLPQPRTCSLKRSRGSPANDLVTLELAAAGEAMGSAVGWGSEWHVLLGLEGFESPRGRRRARVCAAP
jgi:hypothetical protein